LRNRLFNLDRSPSNEGLVEVGKPIMNAGDFRTRSVLRAAALN
jgi:hypothetical protein